MNAKDQVFDVLEALLSRRDRPSVAVASGTALYTEGLGLDSLETAELSAMLEARIGHDPYSAGELPQTVGDLLAYYDQAVG